ncbi:MAG: amidinotransferase [Desulfobacteraceae bacterium]|nr:amidinotransferase [Desulfobacteraceae bacterium]
MFTNAIARKPGENFAKGLTTSNLGTPYYELLVTQHEAYIQTLRHLGLDIVVLESQTDYPDAYFVEDTAVVTPDVAVITNPGAMSRKGEEETIEPVLARYRKTVRIRPPGTVDGGDVLMVGTHFFIGISERTNKEGASQLGAVLEEYGNTWTSVKIGEGLHLKSSINYVGRNTMLVTGEFADIDEIRGYDKIITEKSEEYAANTLLVNDTLIMPRGFPGVKRKLDTLGLEIIELDASEIRKMDGGLTCMSLRF